MQPTTQDHPREFLHKATVREKVSEGGHPEEYGLFDSDIDACRWLDKEGWVQIIVGGPWRTFTKTLDGKERTVEIVKFDFAPIHLLSQSYWDGQRP